MPAHSRPEYAFNPAHVADLHAQIRRYLRRTMPGESPPDLAAALMYEITSLAAAVADTPTDAEKLVLSLIDGARAQIDRYGVGRMHP